MIEAVLLEIIYGLLASPVPPKNSVVFSEAFAAIATVGTRHKSKAIINTTLKIENVFFMRVHTFLV